MTSERVSRTADSLRARYRDSLRRRLAKLEALAEELDDTDAADEIRAHAHQLHGSGTSYGYPDISSRAADVEASDAPELPQKLADLFAVMRATIEQD